MVKLACFRLSECGETLTERWHVRKKYKTIKGKNMERGHRECLCFLLSGLSLGSLSNSVIDGNDNVKKAIDLISKTTTLQGHYTFWYISLPSLHD